VIHEGQPLARRGPSVEDARAVCVLLHGRGRSPDDVLSLAERIGDPEVAWVAPAAADNSWWPGSFLAPLAENEPWLSSALGAVDALLHSLGVPLSKVVPVLNERTVTSLQAIAARQRVDQQVIDYAVRLARATRDWSGLAQGAGSRGALALVRGGRAVALLEGRNFVIPDDIKRVALPALRHRIALAPDALLEGRKADDLLGAVIENVPAPRV